MSLDLTLVPEAVGEAFGISASVAGILLSIVITISILAALSLLKMKDIGLTISGVGLILLFTAMSWFDPWIAMMICLLVAVLMGDKVAKRAQGS